MATGSPRQRRDWLHAVAAALEENTAELVELAEVETALGDTRLTSEVSRAAGQLRFYGDVAAEGSYLAATLDRPTSTTPGLARVNQPLGPVAVFGASNFPFAFGVLGNDFGSALAAGCPVVPKSHPAHPLLSDRLAEVARAALLDAGAPDGSLEMVVGYDAGLALVRDEGVAALAFTGSQAAGLALWRIANERRTVIPTYAGMGTVDPSWSPGQRRRPGWRRSLRGAWAHSRWALVSSAPSPVSCSLQREQRQRTPLARP